MLNIRYAQSSGNFPNAFKLVGHAYLMDKYCRKRDQGLIMNGLLAGDVDPAYVQYQEAIKEEYIRIQEDPPDGDILTYAAEKLQESLPDIQRDALIYCVRSMQIQSPPLCAKIAKGLLFQAKTMSTQGEALWPQAYDAALLKWNSLSLPSEVGSLEYFLGLKEGLRQTAFMSLWYRTYQGPIDDPVLESLSSMRSTLDTYVKESFCQEFFSRSTAHAAYGIECFLAASALATPSLLEIASSHDIKNHLMVHQVHRELKEHLGKWKGYSSRTKGCVEHLVLILGNDSRMQN